MSSCRGHVVRAVLLLVVASVASGCFVAKVVPPRTVPTLSGNDGLVILSVHSTGLPAGKLSFSRVGTPLVFKTMEASADQLTVQVWRMPAGRYYWRDLQISRMGSATFLDQGDGMTTSFSVEPGRISLPPTLYLSTDSIEVRINARNAATVLQRTLDAEFGALIRAYPLVSGNTYPDPYLSFWLSENAPLPGKERAQP